MIKTFHEAPMSVFEEVQAVTDGDYALVHLLDLNPTYLTKFKKAVADGREVILDNSIFELGKAFDSTKYLNWINELNPSWYILPDVLEDSVGTMKNAADWIANFKDKVTSDSKVIGVVQGKSFEELIQCYTYMDKVADVDMIAISFDYSLYENTIGHVNKLVSWMTGRMSVLSKMYSNNIINTSKPHHLLGCSLPQEGRFYSKNPEYHWIYSIDTSNPVVHAIKQINYLPEGLWHKESQKLHELIGYNLDESQKKLMNTNIKKFRKFWNS